MEVCVYCAAVWEPAWDAIPHLLTLICTGIVCSGCSPLAVNMYHEKEKSAYMLWNESQVPAFCSVTSWGHSLLPKKQNGGSSYYLKNKNMSLLLAENLICFFFQFFFFSSLFLSTGADICWRWVVGGSPREGGSPWRGRSVHQNFWAPGKKPQTTFILLYLTSRLLRSAHVQKMSLDTLWNTHTYIYI